MRRSSGRARRCKLSLIHIFDPAEFIRFETVGGVLFGTIQVGLLMGEDARGVNDVVIDAAQAESPLPRLVAIDLSRVTNINSFAVGMLVSIKISIDRLGSSFCLVGLTKPVQELFRVTNLTAVFDIHESRATVRAPADG